MLPSWLAVMVSFFVGDGDDATGVSMLVYAQPTSSKAAPLARCTSSNESSLLFLFCAYSSTAEAAFAAALATPAIVEGVLRT